MKTHHASSIRQIKKNYLRMKKLNTKFFVLFLGVAVNAFIACKKEKPKPVDTTPLTLPCDYFSTNRTLVNDTNKVVDYIINCVMSVDANIVIEPGVVIHFTENAGIIVNSGFFKAVGTADKPIIMRGTLDLHGYWKGIYFQNKSVQNELTYTHISGAGSSAFDSNDDKGSVILFKAKLKMNNSKIEKSGHFGFNAPYDECEFDLKNTYFANCLKAPINILPQYMSLMDPSNLYSNNAEEHIAVVLAGYNLKGNTTIKALSIPYKIYQGAGFYEWLFVEDGLVTFEGPVVLKFGDITGLRVEPNGGIRFEGSASSPALLTGSSSTSGAWKGIYFNASQLNNVLNHTIIEYTGSIAEGFKYGIGMWNSPKISISNSTFRNIDGCAIFDYNNANNPNPNLTLTNISYSNVSGGNMCHP
jgi:hypothetical protein